MRVLVLASTFPRWANDTQPRFILDFCRHLPGCEVHVLVPGAAGAAPRETIDGIHVHRFRYAPVAAWQQLAYGGGMLANVRARPALFLLLPFFLLAMLVAGLRIIRRVRPDIIHAHWIIPQGLVGAILRALAPASRLVVTAHGGDAYTFHGRLGRWLKRRILARADAVTAVSTPMRDDLVRDLSPAQPIQVAPMGLDLARFGGPTPIRGHRLLFVGRLAEKKGVPDLVTAYAKARDRTAGNMPPLLIAGDGPLREQVSALVDTLSLRDDVHLAGWVDPGEVPALMAGSLAVIVPSIVARDGDREGLGLVAVEALAAGTPVIAYDYGAIRDVVTPGVDGLLVPQGDTGALADALLAAAQGNLPAIATAHRDAIRARFDWQAVCAAYRRLYDSLAAGRRGPASDATKS